MTTTGDQTTTSTTLADLLAFHARGVEGFLRATRVQRADREHMARLVSRFQAWQGVRP